jgi:CPA1 family monovalent cation:H+ antiporter
MKKEKIFDDHVMRTIEMQLDFDEAKITSSHMDNTLFLQ